MRCQPGHRRMEQPHRYRRPALTCGCARGTGRTRTKVHTQRGSPVPLHPPARGEKRRGKARLFVPRDFQRRGGGLCWAPDLPLLESLTLSSASRVCSRAHSRSSRHFPPAPRAPGPSWITDSAGAEAPVGPAGPRPEPARDLSSCPHPCVPARTPASLTRGERSSRANRCPRGLPVYTQGSTPSFGGAPGVRGSWGQRAGSSGTQVLPRAPPLWPLADFPPSPSSWRSGPSGSARPRALGELSPSGRPVGDSRERSGHARPACAAGRFPPHPPAVSHSERVTAL